MKASVAEAAFPEAELQVPSPEGALGEPVDEEVFPEPQDEGGGLLAHQSGGGPEEVGLLLHRLLQGAEGLQVLLPEGGEDGEVGLRQGEELRHLPLAVHAELHHGPGALGVQVPEEADKGRGGVEVPRGGGKAQALGQGLLGGGLARASPHGQDRAREEAAEGLAQAQEGLPGVLHLQGGGARLVGQDQACPPGQGLRDEMPPVGGAPGEGGEEASRRGGAAVPDQVPHRPSARMEPSPHGPGHPLRR